MAHSRAYWYTCNGEWFTTFEFANEYSEALDSNNPFKREMKWDKDKIGDYIDMHVQCILIDPSRFNITQNEVDAIEKEYGKFLSFNGMASDATKAREQLMILAMKKGNIRVRETDGKTTVNIYDFDTNKKDLENFLVDKGLDLASWGGLRIISVVGDEIRDGFYTKERCTELFNSLKKERELTEKEILSTILPIV